MDGLRGVPGVHDVSVEADRVRFSVDQGDLNRVMRHLVDYDLRSLTSSPPTLEELFLRHYGDEVAPAAGEVARSR